MSRWEYLDRGGDAIALDADALRTMIASGALPASTRVRRSGAGRWRAAGLVGAFDRALYPAHAFAALPAFDAPDQAALARGTFPPARPWVRAWARLVDLVLVSALVHTVAGAGPWQRGPAGEAALGFMAPLAWVVAEALLLTFAGTTPGKALLRVTVRRRDGRRLAFSASLDRALDVWLKGIGMALPVVSVVAPLVAYRRLARTGVTSWDEAGDVHVSHTRIGPARILGAVALALLASLALAR